MKNVLIQMRNKEIVNMIDNKFMTKTLWLRWFGISKQRVAQIYQEEKADVSEYSDRRGRGKQQPYLTWLTTPFKAVSLQ